MRRFRKWIGAGNARAGEAGFTLLEVLVALGVLSLSLAVLLAIFSQGLDRTRQDETRTAARAMAQLLLTQVESLPPASLKSTSGEVGGFRWKILLRPYGSSEEQRSWTLSPVDVLVEVSWDDHGRNRAVTLSTLRLLPKMAS